MNALRLFGGYEAVVGRMTELVREKLRVMPGGEMIELEQALGLEEELGQILRGSQAVSYRAFQRVAAPLSLSIHQVLCEPSIDDTAQAYWMEQMERSPFVFAAAIEDGNTGAVRVPLAMYVTLRAVEELATQGRRGADAAATLATC